jgi:hypothetical protein
LQSQAGFSDEEVNVTSVRVILQQLQLAANTLCQHQKRHSELHSTYLEELAEAIVLDRSPNLVHDSLAHVKEERVASQIQHLLKRENLHLMFRKIKRILKLVAQQGLSRIDVPDTSAITAAHGDPSNPKDWKGPWVTLTKPTAITEVVESINRKQYHQAHVTPFGSGPVAEAFGRKGDTPLAEALLQGKVPQSLQEIHIMPETRSILNTLATPYPSVQEGSGHIRQDDFVAAYSVSKEATSSSPFRKAHWALQSRCTRSYSSPTPQLYDVLPVCPWLCSGSVEKGYRYHVRERAGQLQVSLPWYLSLV